MMSKLHLKAFDDCVMLAILDGLFLTDGKMVSGIKLSRKDAKAVGRKLIALASPKKESKPARDAIGKEASR